MEDLSDIFSVEFGITIHLETVLFKMIHPEFQKFIIFSTRTNLIDLLTTAETRTW